MNLQDKIRYDPSTGKFYRKLSAGNSKAGDEVGSPDTKGYLRVMISGKRYKLHRLAWYFVHGCWPKDQIDHINGNKADNRITNLRDVSNQTNKLNMLSANSNSLTGILGVSKLPSGRFNASFRGKRLGTFDTAEEAQNKYKETKCKYLRELN